MKNILITGGAGFIGSNFVHYWVKKYPEDQVVVLDKLTYAGCLPNIQTLIDNNKIEFIKGDIRNQELIELLFKKFQIDIVAHFAAESHVDRSIEGPEEFVKTNVLGTLNLLLSAKKIWLDGQIENGCRFHHVSTDEVYGMLEEGDPAFSETTPYMPSSPYSASKAASDHLVRSFGHTYNLPFTMSNCSNNYGPFHFPEKLIPLSLANLLLGKKIGVYGDGRNIRDWLYVEDHCRGIDLIIQKGKNGQTYNIGGNNELRNIEIIEKLCDQIDEIFSSNEELKKMYLKAPPSQNRKSRRQITFIKDRPGHDWRYAIDASKIEKELGYKPKENFESGLDKTINWYLENKDWWMRLL